MLFFFFFKQKTAYEMRISDWSSDVCSSDLGVGKGRAYPRREGAEEGDRRAGPIGEPRRMIRAAALAMMLLLSGCTLRPLYGGGGDGAVATTLRSVAVAPIEGRAGWLVRPALEGRLGAKGEEAAHRPDDGAGDGI